MKDDRYSQFGRQIGKAVEKAVHSSDFTNIKIICDTIKETVQEQVAQQKNVPGAHGPVPPPADSRRAARRAAPPNVRQNYRKAAPPPPSNQNQYYTPTVMPRNKKPKGMISGILMQISGCAGAVVLPFIVWALSGYMGMLATVSSAVVWGGLCLGSLVRGIQIRHRAERCVRYRELMQGCRFFSIEQIASSTGLKKPFVTKDLRKMIRLGLFPGAHIDEQDTCIMLDYETYLQYLNARENMRQRELEEERKKKLGEETRTNPEEASAVSAALAEGREYIRQIREANDIIADKELSEKLYRLEDVTGKIFTYVEQHPDKLSEIRKLMQYYLPTTQKLLRAYCEFESQRLDGDNIAAAKNEIEEALDTITMAFENLLDSLFQDDAFDISTDISALEAMLAQEGLTGSDFKSSSAEKPS